jgi:hypothetical protein
MKISSEFEMLFLLATHLQICMIYIYLELAVKGNCSLEANCHQSNLTGRMTLKVIDMPAFGACCSPHRHILSSHD